MAPQAYMQNQDGTIDPLRREEVSTVRRIRAFLTVAGAFAVPTAILAFVAVSSIKRLRHPGEMPKDPAKRRAFLANFIAYHQRKDARTARLAHVRDILTKRS